MWENVSEYMDPMGNAMGNWDEFFCNTTYRSDPPHDAFSSCKCHEIYRWCCKWKMLGDWTIEVVSFVDRRTFVCRHHLPQKTGSRTCDTKTAGTPGTSPSFKLWLPSFCPQKEESQEGDLNTKPLSFYDSHSTFKGLGFVELVVFVTDFDPNGINQSPKFSPTKCSPPIWEKIFGAFSRHQKKRPKTHKPFADWRTGDVHF